MLNQELIKLLADWYEAKAKETGEKDFDELTRWLVEDHLYDEVMAEYIKRTN